MTSVHIPRKSSYGRTELFLKNPSIVQRDVRSSNAIPNNALSYRYHSMQSHESLRGSCCWHCCDGIDDEDRVVPIPAVYDSVSGTFHVFGRTCSPGCAKAYILEHNTFDRGQCLNVLVRMLRDVYGITERVVETPPRPALRRFGGVFDTSMNERARCRLVKPPFVAYCMVVEEQRGVAPDASSDVHMSAMGEDCEDASVIEEPPPTGAYHEFIERKRQQTMMDDVPADTVTSSSSSSSRPRRATRTVPGDDATANERDGPMAKFFKRGKSE